VVLEAGAEEDEDEDEEEGEPRGKSAPNQAALERAKNAKGSGSMSTSLIMADHLSQPL
jgi:hypothetical protein